MNRDIDSVIREVCQAIRNDRSHDRLDDQWPSNQLQTCRRLGVFQQLCFDSEDFIPSQNIRIPSHLGAQDSRNAEFSVGWDEIGQLRFYRCLSQECLLTAFVLTQWHAAVKRIKAGTSKNVKDKWLPGLGQGELFTTVGISHLTTSRQHLATPVLQAFETDSGYRLHGYSPWVTGAQHADVIVVGATLPNHHQILAAVSTASNGVRLGSGMPLLALRGSCTDVVHFDSVEVRSEDVFAGPIESVLSQSNPGGAGGLQTTALAAGLTASSISYLREQSVVRSELQCVVEHLEEELSRLDHDLFQLATGANVCTSVDLRQRANSLVLRATQAALASAKGAGFVAGHPVEQWVRQALFFLVWSCPQPVVHGNLCELAGVDWPTS